MTDFVTESKQVVNFESHADLKNYIQARAITGDYEDLAIKLEAAGLTVDKNLLGFFVARLKSGDFQV